MVKPKPATLYSAKNVEFVSSIEILSKWFVTHCDLVVGGYKDILQCLLMHSLYVNNCSFNMINLCINSQ